MIRRSVLGVVGILLGFSGCLGDHTDDARVEETAYPDRPDELTRESVLEYVREHEETRVYNDHVDDVIDLSVACDVALDRVVDGTYYVVSRCVGAVEWEEGDAIGHGDIEVPPFW